jgi:hypothetical protein
MLESWCADTAMPDSRGSDWREWVKALDSLVHTLKEPMPRISPDKSLTWEKDLLRIWYSRAISGGWPSKISFSVDEWKTIEVSLRRPMSTSDLKTLIMGIMDGKFTINEGVE